MAFPGEIGWIGQNCPDHRQTPLKTTIMRSNAGYFVATVCPECQKEDPSPHSRESHYYDDKMALINAVLTDTVRWRDTNFHGPVKLEDIAWDEFKQKRELDARKTVSRAIEEAMGAKE